MDAIELLTTRASNGKLTEPGPDDATLTTAFAAATHVPDHATLRPWRIRVVRGSAREKLGELMADTLRRKQPDATADELAKMRQKALRAPVILVVGARVEAHPKVPAIEQILAAGSAAHALLLALHALGFAGIWRTGDAAYDEHVKRAFGFRASDALIGFLYVGTPKQTPPAMTRPAPMELVREWLAAED